MKTDNQFNFENNDHSIKRILKEVIREYNNLVNGKILMHFEFNDEFTLELSQV